MMLALVLLVTAAAPQDSDRLKKFEKSVASDKSDRKGSGDEDLTGPTLGFTVYF